MFKEKQLYVCVQVCACLCSCVKPSWKPALLVGLAPRICPFPTVCALSLWKNGSRGHPYWRHSKPFLGSLPHDPETLKDKQKKCVCFKSFSKLYLMSVFPWLVYDMRSQSNSPRHFNFQQIKRSYIINTSVCTNDEIKWLCTWLTSHWMCVFVIRPVYGDQGLTANAHILPSTDWTHSQRYLDVSVCLSVWQTHTWTL